MNLLGGRVAGRTAIAAGVCALALVPSAATAKPGEVFVADEGNPDAVLRIPPEGGTSTALAAGPPYGQLQGIGISPTGKLFIADANPVAPVAADGALFALDPLTAERQTVAAGPPLLTPVAVSFDLERKLLMTDQDGPSAGNEGAIYRYDPISFASLGTFTSGPPFDEPWDTAVAPSGEIFVIDQVAGPGFSGALFRIDPATRTVTTLYAGPPLRAPSGLARQPDGKLVIADEDGALAGGGFRGAIFRFDPATGSMETLLIGAPLGDTYDVAVAPDRSLLISSQPGPVPGAIFRFDPKTGALTTFSAGPPLNAPNGIAIDPPTCRGKRATVVGSTGKDRITGSDQADVIALLNGNDRVSAGKGKDIVCGGKGRDRIKGGKGKDRMNGGKGEDRCDGGKGEDAEKSCEEGEDA